MAEVPALSMCDGSDGIKLAIGRYPGSGVLGAAFFGHAVISRPCAAGASEAEPLWLSSLKTLPVIQQQYSLAAYWGGSLWYNLAVVQGDFRTFDPFRNAAAWQWDDPSNLVEADPKKEPPLHQADGELADALRDLRERWLGGEIGRVEAGFIPVLGKDGTRYALRVRAATPFDNTSSYLTLPP